MSFLNEKDIEDIFVCSYELGKTYVLMSKYNLDTLIHSNFWKNFDVYLHENCIQAVWIINKSNQLDNNLFSFSNVSWQTNAEPNDTLFCLKQIKTYLIFK